MKSSVGRIFAIGLAAAVLQEVLISRVSVFGVHPDVLLGFALVVAAVGGAERGAIAGLFAGFVVDSISGGTLGPAVITYTLVAFVVGALSEDTTDYSWVVASTAFAGSIVAVFAAVGTRAVMTDFDSSIGWVLWVALVVAAVNAMFAPLAARAFRNAWTRRSSGSRKREFSW